MAGQKRKRQQQVEQPASVLSSRHWWIGVAVVLVLACLIRFWDIDLKPLHHDEGVNGFFLRNVQQEGVFRYDPANYHGPTLPYFAFVTTSLLGTNTFAVRLVPLLFGLGVVGLALACRDRLGSIGALAAAAFLAIAPGPVFHSRYFIHEMILVFFTFTLVLSVWEFSRGRGQWWLLPAAVSAAMMFITKETCIISFGVLLIALGMMWLDRRLRGGNGLADEPPGEPYSPRGIVIAGSLSVAVAVGLSIAFYSAFFQHWPGVRDSLHTFELWAKTGTTAHTHPLHTYAKWLWKLESPLVLLALAGTVEVVLRRRERFVLFAALWGWGTMAAYSLIPYKTPWLTLNFVVPLALVAGYAVERIARRAGLGAAAAVAAVALLVSAYQSWDVNFRRYDDEAVPYVYAPTNREFLRLIDQIERLADRAGSGTNTPVAVLYPEYWPMPWYLREYRSAEYFGSVVPTNSPIVVGSEALRPQIEAILGPRYQFIRSYHQRNGLAATLYARRDVIDCPVNEVPVEGLIPLVPLKPVVE
jgi:uncharacterized protein (TIGR03663 family)